MNGRKTTIIPQDEWLKEHKSKFDAAKLSRNERLRRYRDYASSAAGAAHSANPRSSVQRSPMRGPTAASADERQQLFIAMNDPFTACSTEGVLPRVPDGTTKHTGLYKFKFNVDVYSDVNGRAFFMLDACPFRCFAVSQTTSTVTAGDPIAEAGFVASAEYDAYAVAVARNTNQVGDMPAWSSGAWSIPSVKTRNYGIGSPPLPPGSVLQATCDMQPCVGYSSLWDLAQAWRPVCAGMNFKNTSKVLDRQGTVAVARWPGALGLPTTANQLLVIDASTTVGAPLAAFQGQGPNFATVQTLPTCKVVPVCEGFAAVWAPESVEGQAVWRPVHPKPIVTQGTLEGVEAFSDEVSTGVVILPDPCAGDPGRYEALLDRVYTQNASCGASAILADNAAIDTDYPQYYGLQKGLYFQEWAAAPSGTNLDNATITSYALRDVVKSFNDTNMIVDNTALIAVFEGCDPETLLGTMEVVLGVEYIADSRIVSTGNGPSTGKLVMTKSKQLDVHHATIEAMSHVPAVVESGVSIVQSIAGAVPKVVGAISSAAPYVEAALAAFGALL